MSLQKAPPLFVPFGGGLQTDVDDKLLPLGKMLDLENCYLTRQGEWIKRFGTTVLPAVSNPNGQLATHQGALVSVASAQGAPPATLATPSSTQWVPLAGDMRPGINLTRTRVAGSASSPDTVTGGGFAWTICIDTSGALQIVGTDLATGHRAYSTTVALVGGAATWQSWKAVFAGTKAVFVCLDNLGTISYYVVDSVTLVLTTTTSVTVAKTNCNLRWMAAALRVSNNTVMVAFPDATPNVACIDFDPVALTKTAWTPKDSGGASIPYAPGTVGWMRDGGGAAKVALITASTAQGLRVQWDFPSAGTTRQAASSYVIDAGFTGVAVEAAGTTTNTTASGEFSVVYYDASSETSKVGRRSSGSITTYLLARQCVLKSQLWTQLGEVYCVVQYPSATDGTHVVLRVPPAALTVQSATPVAKIAVRGATKELSGISSVSMPAANQFVVGLNYTPIFDPDRGAPDTFGVEVVALTHFTLPQSAIGITREAIGSLFAPGAAVGQFDGALFAEAGFVCAPRTITTLTPSVGGGLTASSTYWYVIVYMYLDAQGKIWRSAASLPASVVLGAGDGTVTLSCPTLTMAGRPVTIEVYRGAAGDATTFQKAGTVANDQTATTVSFVDTMTDLVLAGKEFLYTNGGVLDNDTPPGFLSLVEAQNRSWGISSDDPQVLWPSKEHTLSAGVEFSEALALDVRDNHGPMRALAQIDGRPVVFKDDAVYVVDGDGPNALGQGGGWSARMVCSGIGCSNAQAVLETKDGVIFRSSSARAGFFLLDRGLSIQYIGGPVQRWNSETITASMFVSSYLQARFLTLSGRTLVYDLVTQLWSTFTGQPCATAVSWNGVPVYLSTATLHALYEDQTGATLTDDGAPTTMLVGSPWLQINQIRGYQRFYRQQLTGEVAGSSITLWMKLYRDLGTAPLVSKSLLTPVGVLNRELHYSTKVGSLKIVVTDGGSTTGILKVSGTTILYGIKSGTKPTAAANRLT